MPKRSKNSTDGAVFTYHERRNMDHGSTHLRLPDAAFKPWDCCALRLTPPTDPVLTPHGVLYEREAVLRELLRQREGNRSEEERIAAALVDEEARKEVDRQASEQDAIARFERSQDEVKLATEEGKKGIVGLEESKNRGVESNFWLPSVRNKVRSAGGVANDGGKKRKKSLKTRCPISKKPLRARDLIALKLTLNKMSKGEGANGGAISTTGKYMCPVCQAVLVNAAKPIALRTGTVLCSQCVTKFVMKEEVDPCTSTAIDLERDVVPILNVGTAFAASAADDPTSREATLYKPSVR